MTSSVLPPDTRPPAALSVTLWVVQILLALMFIASGLWKLLTPIEQLAESFPWVGEVSAVLVRGTSLLDVVGGLGLLLPSVTRIRPRVAVAAAIGCAALQLGAIVFHVSRGEVADIPFNLVLLTLALFVAWGRNTADPVAPRG